jgi:hypothetical protein
VEVVNENSVSSLLPRKQRSSQICVLDEKHDLKNEDFRTRSDSDFPIRKFYTQSPVAFATARAAHPVTVESRASPQIPAWIQCVQLARNCLSDNHLWPLGWPLFYADSAQCRTGDTGIFSAVLYRLSYGG